MASQSTEQSIRNATSKPLNPEADPFYGSNSKTWHPQPGLLLSPGLPQIQPSMHSPILTYHLPPWFGSFCLITCQIGVSARFTEYKTEEHMGERMRGNAQRPLRPRCMPQKKNRSAINARKEHGNNRWKVGEKVLRDGHPIIPFPTTIEECSHSRTTTIMIKNIPYHFQCKELLTILDNHCSQQNQSSQRVSSLSMYDFIYLPMDYKKFANEKRQSNLGYAFVNFTSAKAAFRFFQQFNGQKWTGNENWKVCEVTRAQIQGKEALVKKFKEKVFRCGDPSFRPVEFRPARDGADHGMKGISVGKFEEGLPDASKPRKLPRRSRKPYPGVVRTC